MNKFLFEALIFLLYWPWLGLLKRDPSSMAKGLAGGCFAVGCLMPIGSFVFWTTILAGIISLVMVALKATGMII